MVVYPLQVDGGFQDLLQSVLWKAKILDQECGHGFIVLQEVL